MKNNKIGNLAEFRKWVKIRLVEKEISQRELAAQTVKHWKLMKNRRNRIAFQGKEGAWEWYWLMNRHNESASNFTIVDSSGDAHWGDASFSAGVRPVFLLDNVCTVCHDE